jgi:hypothetical protein
VLVNMCTPVAEGVVQCDAGTVDIEALRVVPIPCGQHCEYLRGEGSTSAMSSNDNPVRLKSFCTASTGPWPIVAGSHPAAVQSTQA